MKINEYGCGGLEWIEFRAREREREHVRAGMGDGGGGERKSER